MATTENQTIIINKPVTKSLLMVAILSSRCGLVQMNLFILTSEKYKIVLILSVSWTYKFTCRAAWSWTETVFIALSFCLFDGEIISVTEDVLHLCHRTSQ